MARHEPRPHPRGTWCRGRNRAPHHPVRTAHPRRQDRQGQPLPQGSLGDAAAAAAKTNTFLGERYRRIVERHGELKALVAVARSILAIIWHLLTNPAAQTSTRWDPTTTPTASTPNGRSATTSPQLTAMGYRVTLEPAA